jgi:phenylacetate-coenzyme A ligase PaaK-like adenylate-forming protein
MTFVPNLNFLEFMTRKEYVKWSSDHSYRPRTLLLDEVVPGERYAVVVTNFLGGAFVRYLLGDMIEITSLRNDKLNINIPQMQFFSRADNVLDFAGASLTEKTIWQAIEDSGLAYVDWLARKEVRESPVLHIYVELKNEHKAEEVTAAIDEQLRKTREDYAYMVRELGFKLLEVSLLPGGAFQRYIARQQAAGADPAHLKPPHINPTDDVLAVLGVEPEVTVRV